ncbi:MAG TPA: glycosyltransferase family 2 protein, partial [Acidobacteriota bacterium]|nr:glycosyltransferase family 2 protein [Acidobacteriota bacterium]
MKLIIQIPCHNEAATLPVVLAEIPRRVDGFDAVEILVIDDGSVDGTSEVASRLGVDHIVRLNRRRGLATAFRMGLEAALSRGADVVVNTDGDNQYRGTDIPKLTAPILRGEADLVVGARPIDNIEHFSPLKKRLQRLGTWVVRRISHTEIQDAASGFRAMSREAALRLNVFSSYTYTLETIIQAGLSNMRVLSVPVGTNPPLRESRLIRSIPSYLKRSILTMIRVFVLYKPLRFFVWLGGIVFAVGSLLGLRFVYYWMIGQGTGKVQSLILAAVLLLMGFQLAIAGLLSDLIATNRRILEELQVEARRNRLLADRPPWH